MTERYACAHCHKAVSRKSARLINGRVDPDGPADSYYYERTPALSPSTTKPNTPDDTGVEEEVK